MNPSLLTYAQAAEALKPMKISHWTLRGAAAKRTPIKRRLRIVKLGHRTVGIRISDLMDWQARNAV